MYFQANGTIAWSNRVPLSTAEVAAEILDTGDRRAIRLWCDGGDQRPFAGDPGRQEEHRGGDEDDRLGGVAGFGAGAGVSGVALGGLGVGADQWGCVALHRPESDPLGTGWNIIQSKAAIGSGGVFGKGCRQRRPVY